MCKYWGKYTGIIWIITASRLENNGQCLAERQQYEVHYFDKKKYLNSIDTTSLSRCNWRQINIASGKGMSTNRLLATKGDQDPDPGLNALHDVLL